MVNMSEFQQSILVTEYIELSFFWAYVPAPMQEFIKWYLMLPLLWIGLGQHLR